MALTMGGLGGVAQVVRELTRDEAIAMRRQANRTGKQGGAESEVFYRNTPEGPYVLVRVSIDALQNTWEESPSEWVGPGVDPTVERITRYARTSGAFPPGYAVFARRTGRLFLADGNHRHAAARLRGEQTYLVVMPKADYEAWRAVGLPSNAPAVGGALGNLGRVKKAPIWVRAFIEKNAAKLREKTGMDVDADALGCGDFGCVFPTSDPRWVVKITKDPTEGLLVQRIIAMRKSGARLEGIVFYKSIFASKSVDGKKDVYVIVRETVTPIEWHGGGFDRERGYGYALNRKAIDAASDSLRTIPGHVIERSLAALGKAKVAALEYYEKPGYYRAAKKMSMTKDQAQQAYVDAMTDVGDAFPYVGETVFELMDATPPLLLRDVHSGNIAPLTYDRDDGASAGTIVIFDLGYTPTGKLTADEQSAALLGLRGGGGEGADIVPVHGVSAVLRLIGKLVNAGAPKGSVDARTDWATRVFENLPKAPDLIAWVGPPRVNISIGAGALHGDRVLALHVDPIEHYYLVDRASVEQLARVLDVLQASPVAVKGWGRIGALTLMGKAALGDEAALAHVARALRSLGHGEQLDGLGSASQFNAREIAEAVGRKRGAEIAAQLRELAAKKLYWREAGVDYWRNAVDLEMELTYKRLTSAEAVVATEAAELLQKQFEAGKFTDATKLQGLNKKKGARLSSLAAAPGDVDGFVQETAEAAVVHIEHMFKRAGLTVAGKPLGARAPREAVSWGWAVYWDNGGEASGTFSDRYLTEDDAETAADDWVAEQEGDGNEEAGAEALFVGDRYRFQAYAWIARQFVRGATGLGAVGWIGGVFRDEEMVRLGTEQLSYPETRLGLDLWRLGRNVHEEVWGSYEPERYPRPNRRDPAFVDVRARILESVRARLNWPVLPADYDPPPPSKWPSAD